MHRCQNLRTWRTDKQIHTLTLTDILASVGRHINNILLFHFPYCFVSCFKMIRNFFDFFQNRQSDLERLFVGQEGRKAAEGKPPAGSNVDFLRQFPWMEHFLAQSPEQRGIRFRTPARWLIPR